MAQAARKAEVFEFPSGGIADFYMEDDEIAALEREEAKEQFGNKGIANFSGVATRMASYGRYGDDTVAHVETGELVIPKALIDENPRLRDSIFQHLEELGVEDPERYVVGSNANSINPNTGLPEFFLKKFFRGVKKAVSKVAKGVKKAVKSVVKVVKKAAPIIIPLVLNYAFPGLGTIYSGALGSGIGTLVQGGSLKDAFKSALIGGAIGGAVSGVQGAMAAKTAGTSMTQGALDGIKGAAKLSNLTTAGQQLASGQFGQAGYDAVTAAKAAAGDQMFAGLADAPPTVAQEAAAATDFGAGQGPYDPNLAATPMGATDAGLDASTRNQLYGVQPRPVVQGAPNTITGISSGYGPDPMAMGSTAGVGDQSAMLTSGVPDSTLSNIQTGSTNTIGGDGLLDTAKGYYDTAKDYLFQGGQSDAAVNLAKEKAGQAYLKDMAAAGITPTQAGLEAAKAAAGPGILAKFGPSAALAGTAAYALGAFDAPEVEGPDLGPTGADMLRLTPYEYLIGQQNLRTRESQGPVVVASQYAAEGGEIFPRRVGGIMPDEGVPGKDSVRAMLMPGEFVMTTDAVKGLGNGNNDQGINNMYQMMRGLEAKGRAMA